MVQHPVPPPFSQPKVAPHLPPRPSDGYGDHLHKPRNGIPVGRRRSMEDESRPLPSGWIRQFDVNNGHQYFVDTAANPPRSIWHHPYDDEEYLSTLPSEKREELEELSRSLSKVDLEENAGLEEVHDDDKPAVPGAFPADRKASAASAASVATTNGSTTHDYTMRSYPRSQPASGATRFGRHLMDKATATTHTEREAERRRRAEDEREAYRAHQQMRTVMTRAAQTGEPQLLGRDQQTGQEVYMEPPGGIPAPGPYNNYNPYAQGPYAHPNARYVPYPPPQYPYGRPHGYGSGGGMGMPIATFAGGMLLGGLLF